MRINHGDQMKFAATSEDFHAKSASKELQDMQQTVMSDGFKQTSETASPAKKTNQKDEKGRATHDVNFGRPPIPIAPAPSKSRFTQYSRHNNDDLVVSNAKALGGFPSGRKT